MKSKQIIDNRREKELTSGRKLVLSRTAYKVPEDPKFPSGIKYRFQSCYKNGELVVRYDNADSSNKHMPNTINTY